MSNFIDSFFIDTSVDPVAVLINVVLSAIFAGLIYAVFVPFGNTFSNRKQFGKISCF